MLAAHHNHKERANEPEEDPRSSAPAPQMRLIACIPNHTSSTLATPLAHSHSTTSGCSFHTSAPRPANSISSAGIHTKQPVTKKTGASTLVFHARSSAKRLWMSSTGAA